MYEAYYKVSYEANKTCFNASHKACLKASKLISK